MEKERAEVFVTSQKVEGHVLIVELKRPEARNAVNGVVAGQLEKAFQDFEKDDDLHVAILYGGSCFCSGADLKAISSNDGRQNKLTEDGPGPMGPTRMRLGKPVIGAISGYAVAGGLELALWCDLRVCDKSAIFGVFCRRWGVPLIDGGSFRLPRVVGLGRAMDMTLTGRPVNAQEALHIGLVSHVFEEGQVLSGAIEMAKKIGAFPQRCLRSDRLSTYNSFDNHDDSVLIKNEYLRGIGVLGEGIEGAGRFAEGRGRGGSFAKL